MTQASFLEILGADSKDHGGCKMQASLFDDRSTPHPTQYQPDLMSEHDIAYSEVESLLEDYLKNQLSGFEMENITAIPETDVSSKFRFSSALQKTVRRGYVDDAIKYGLTYLRLDSSGFWSRLPVIAFEDCGLANPVGIALCLAAARSKTLRGKLGGDDRVASYIIKILAEGTKDRSVCDMMQIHWHRPLKHKELAAIKKATSSELAEMALAENLPSFFRTSAAWTLWGTSRHENKNLPSRTGSKEVFCSMVERLNIPPLIKYICLRGMVGCRFPMPITYPFMWQRLQKSMYYSIEKTSFPAERFYIGDVPEEAFCQYTRQGKTSFAYYSKACRPIDDWLTRKGITDKDRRVAAISTAVFVCESALLDRRLVFEGLDDITEAVEQIDYQNVGLSLDDGRELAQLILENHEVLRQSRQKVVAGK